ncbi:hypothetical protein BJY52DRAFT_1251716 [Lactarius psammicola]|nr:hypothetical protein BJY52DRAFT_1251716 [Lactarius psammicola]
MRPEDRLWTVTPLVYLNHLSARLGSSQKDHDVVLYTSNLRFMYHSQHQYTDSRIVVQCRRRSHHRRPILPRDVPRGTEVASRAQPDLFANGEFNPCQWQYAKLISGYSPMTTESQTRLPPHVKPDAVYSGVGGGRLLCSVVKSSRDAGRDDGACSTPPDCDGRPDRRDTVVALDTHGSTCFYDSVAVNRRTPTDEAPRGVVLRG